MTDVTATVDDTTETLAKAALGSHHPARSILASSDSDTPSTTTASFSASSSAEDENNKNSKIDISCSDHNGVATHREPTPPCSTKLSPQPFFDDAHSHLTDVERIALAEELAKEDQLFVAARLLRSVENKTLLNATVHPQLINLATKVEDAIADLVGDVPDGWKRQSESHDGKRDTLVYYKVDEEARLTCRLETPVEPSLLIPLLSVLNESELYPTWIPSWKIPRMGFESVKLLDKHNRANQVLQVVTVSPWPFGPREVIIQATCLDGIQAQGFIGIHLNTLPTGGVVPPVVAGTERVDFDGAFLFRACPADHEVLKHSTRVYDEAPILVTFKMYVDAKMKGIPTWIVNFITRSAMGQIWNALLKVAEDIRDGKRPLHKTRIEEQADFYNWVQSRIDFMFDQLKQNGEGK